MMIYLAARYSRRLELCEYREQLRAIGHAVDAVWLNGEHQISDMGTPIGESGEAIVEAGDVREVTGGSFKGASVTVYFVNSSGHFDCRLAADFDGCRKGEIVVVPQKYIGEDKRAGALRQKFARDDYADVLACDCLVAFTEEPRQGGRNRGGRHVELGIALGLGKRVIVVGPRENLFCWLDQVRQFDHWCEFYATLINEQECSRNQLVCRAD